LCRVGLISKQSAILADIQSTSGYFCLGSEQCGAFTADLSHELLVKYKAVAAKCKLEIARFVSCKEEKLVASNNLGKFFRYCGSRFNTRHNVAALKRPDGTLVAEPLAKAELLNTYFASIYTTDNHSLPAFDAPPQAAATGGLSDVNFNSHRVYAQLRKLKAKSSAGPDKTPPIFLKHCALQLCSPLSFLFQYSFDSGYIPDIWKSAFITPVFKKGSPLKPENYRPISLTCNICKVMECIIKNSML
jgi:hypothetical protein